MELLPICLDLVLTAIAGVLSESLLLQPFLGLLLIEQTLHFGETPARLIYPLGAFLSHCSLRFLHQLVLLLLLCELLLVLTLALLLIDVSRLLLVLGL